MGIFGKTDDKPGQSAPRAAVPAPSTAPAAAPARAPQAPAAGSPCVIGAKTQIKGEITGSENLVVEGLVEGTIRITGDLRVAPGGVVKATVTAQSVLIAGELVGDCHATHRTEIQASGRLTGNIRAPRVVIIEGATFRGNSDMTPGRDGDKA
jgi:cytoskeletal protein CcmA (bactofilin family)